ncbi:hypothetical protein AX16_008309 [Volvariella volvacea WC 439]|nr:hypothetical protein AX16_008309 [Volvariella volvacea WC 439]
MGFFDDIADTFSRDGSATRFLESLPIIGRITAGHKVAHLHWRRVVGFMVGGPVGAVAGGALGSAGGLGSEYGIAQTIEDKQVKGDVGEISLGRAAAEIVIGGAAGFMGGGGVVGVGKAGLEASKEAGKHIGKELIIQMGKGLVQTGAGTVGKAGTAGIIGDATKQAFMATNSQRPQANEGDGPNISQKEPKKEKPKLKQERIVTEGQQGAAEELMEVCAFVNEQFLNVESGVGDLVNTLAHGLDVMICKGNRWDPANEYYLGQKIVCSTKLLVNREKIDGKMTAQQGLEFDGYMNAQLHNAIVKLNDKMQQEIEYGWFPDTGL